MLFPLQKPLLSLCNFDRHGHRLLQKCPEDSKQLTRQVTVTLPQKFNAFISALSSELMGFPFCKDADAWTVQLNWLAVLERIQNHPKILETENPLRLALANEANPVTKEVVEAVANAAPETITNLRSHALRKAYKNHNVCQKDREFMKLAPFLFIDGSRVDTNFTNH